MKLLHISDLHYRIAYETGDGTSSYQSIFRHMTSPLEQLDRCLNMMGENGRSELNGVLISGDLTENGTAADYEQLRRELEERFPDLPLVVTLGNHDNHAEFREGWLGQVPDESPYCHTERIGDVSILALDNAGADYPNGIIDGARCSWFRQAALNEQGQTIILMMHHHLISQQAVFPACRVDDKFLPALHEFPVAAILCGHTHQLYRGVYGGIPYRTGMSLSFIGEDRGEITCMQEACGYSCYEFKSGQLVAEFHEAVADQPVLGYVRF